MIPLLLAGCDSQASAPAAEAKGATPAQTFAGAGRDRLCLGEGGRAAFVTYAANGDANCSVRGRLVPEGIAPDGDESCRIAVAKGNGRVRLGPVTPQCAYYCGPKASYAGKTFVQQAKPAPVTDLAGDPLC